MLAGQCHESRVRARNHQTIGMWICNDILENDLRSPEAVLQQIDPNRAMCSLLQDTDLRSYPPGLFHYEYLVVNPPHFGGRLRVPQFEPELRNASFGPLCFV